MTGAGGCIDRRLVAWVAAGEPVARAFGLGLAADERPKAGSLPDPVSSREQRRAASWRAPSGRRRSPRSHPIAPDVAPSRRGPRPG
jgi:hypothetical protein